jgi:hypothetical protein
LLPCRFCRGGEGREGEVGGGHRGREGGDQGYLIIGDGIIFLSQFSSLFSSFSKEGPGGGGKVDELKNHNPRFLDLFFPILFKLYFSLFHDVIFLFFSVYIPSFLS